MSILRQLSLVYLAGASVFAAAALLDRNPGVTHAAALATVETARLAAAHVVRPVVVATGYQPKPVIVPRAVIAIAPPPPARWIIPIAPPADQGVAPVQLARVAARLRDSLSPELLENFELFLYVSKAAHGPLAQRLYVFRKEADGSLGLIHNWPASTGRDDSVTPEGYFELDPHRMYKSYVSGEWHASMPFSMFLDWDHDGRKTGVAIHSIIGDEARWLGHRASHGCIRLGRENAELLFNLIRTKYRGAVPRFAYDDELHTTTRDGSLMRDADGRLVKANGYKVLVFVENYGGKDVVATLF